MTVYSHTTPLLAFSAIGRFSLLHQVHGQVRIVPSVRFLGPVNRATAGKLYRESDLFLFPTLSDGFGLTQLGVLAHGPPVIASTLCGRVVVDHVSGLELREASSEEIAETIMLLVRDPQVLAKLKSNAKIPDKYHPGHLAPELIALEKS